MCLTASRETETTETVDELLDELSLPLLKDQVDVLGAPERYAMFANKDWWDALFAHLAQKLRIWMCKQPRSPHQERLRVSHTLSFRKNNVNG